MTGKFTIHVSKASAIKDTQLICDTKFKKISSSFIYNLIHASSVYDSLVTYIILMYWDICGIVIRNVVQVASGPCVEITT